VQRASVVLVTDVSRSMPATDVSPTRLAAARQAALSFLDKVPSELRVGLLTYSDVAQTLQTPATDHKAVTQAKRLRVPIYTVALGTPDGTITLRGQTLNLLP